MPFCHQPFKLEPGPEVFIPTGPSMRSLSARLVPSVLPTRLIPTHPQTPGQVSFVFHHLPKKIHGVGAFAERDQNSLEKCGRCDGTIEVCRDFDSK